MKIRPIFVLMLVGILSLAFSGAYQEVPDRPVISLDADGVTAAELIYSFCWPAATGNLRCDFELDFEPRSVLQINPGQAITVIVSSTASDPSSLTVTIIDAAGAEEVINLEPATQAILDTDLEAGLYTLEVTAMYDDIAGTEAFITYRFGLEVLGAGTGIVPTQEVAAATSEPTEEPAEGATTEPGAATTEPAEETEEPVLTEEPVATEEPDAAATATPTTTAPQLFTNTPAAESLTTAEPGETAQATETPTTETQPIFTNTSAPQIATTAAPTATVEGALPVVTEEAAGATVAASPTATEDAAAATDIAIATNISGSETAIAIAATAAAETTTGATNTTMPLGGTTETSVAGATSTTVQLPGAATATPAPVTTEPPTMTLPPAPTTEVPAPTGPTATTVAISGPPTQALPPAPSPTTAIAQLTEPPAIEAQFAGRIYPAAGVNFCQTSATGERVCVDRPVEAATPIQLLEGAAMLVHLLEGPRPEGVTLAFLNADTLAVVAETDREGDHLLLFNVNVVPGTYFMRVTVDWGSTIANYFFPVRVN